MIPMQLDRAQNGFATSARAGRGGLAMAKSKKAAASASESDKEKTPKACLLYTSPSPRDRSLS
eukprot:9437839-Pyramimonas_sp.AAC.1